MNITLDALTRDDCEHVRQWRNRVPVGLRTPFLLTSEMQADWYERVICDRRSEHRYWAVRQEGQPWHPHGDVVAVNGVTVKPEVEARLVACVGLTNIEWENHRAEISLITDPDRRGEGIGEQSVWLALEQGFDALGLQVICGEVYHCNPARTFWAKFAAMNLSTVVVLPTRKCWAGHLWDSDYFTITAPSYRRVKNSEAA